MGGRSLATGLGHHRQRVLRGVQLYPPSPGVRPQGLKWRERGKKKKKEKNS
jgi:hypothetical protein